MGSVLRSKRTLAAILIVVVAVSVTGISLYGITNVQRSNQLNSLMATYFFRAGSLRIVSQAPSITEMIFGYDGSPRRGRVSTSTTSNQSTKPRDSHIPCEQRQPNP